MMRGGWWLSLGLLLAACTSGGEDEPKPDETDVVDTDVVDTDGVDTDAADTDTVEPENQAPVVESVSLSPEPVRTADVLTADVIVTDADEDATTQVYTWYVNGAEVQAGPATSLDGSVFFDKGNTVQLVVTASDPEGAVGEASSDTLTVQNTPPTAPTLAITGATPGDDLACMVVLEATDADEDAITYAFSWQVDGVDSGITSDTVPASETAEGESWTCSVQASDGEATGDVATVTTVPSCPANDPECDGFFLDPNGVTVRCPDVPIDATGLVDGVTYTRRDRDFLRDTAIGEEFVFACTSGITDMSSMFESKVSFNQDIGTWDLSSVTDTSVMFFGADSFNQDIGSWDVSQVTDMRRMFTYATAFNQDIGGWDVARVVDMSDMFTFAVSFDQDIGSWNVGQVTDMGFMFYQASAFNGDIGGWDVSNVSNMELMFQDASAFNQDIGGWDVSRVTDMEYMFRGAELFNQDIGDWDVSAVTDMSSMFAYAYAFDQELSGWDVSSVTRMSFMFSWATAFNDDLSGWCVTNITDQPIGFQDGTLSWFLPRPVWGTCP